MGFVQFGFTFVCNCDKDFNFEMHQFDRYRQFLLTKQLQTGTLSNFIQIVERKNGQSFVIITGMTTCLKQTRI